MRWLNFKVIMLNEKKDTKGYTLYDSVYMSFYKRQCRGETAWAVAWGAAEGRRGWRMKGVGTLAGGENTCSVLVW